MKITTVLTSFAVGATLITSAGAVLTASNLLAYYPFDGNGNDASGNAPDATLVGPATIGAGTIGSGSLDLSGAGNGAGAIVVAGTHFDSAFANDAMSVSFWQFNNGFSNSSAFWINSPGATANQRGFQAHTPWSNGTVFFDSAGCCATPGQRLTATGATAGVWQHFAFTKDSAGNKSIWIDGVEVTQAGAGALLAFDGAMTIGGESDLTDPTMPNNSFDGFIDDLAVWDVALTGAEVQALAGGAATPTIVVPEPSGVMFGMLGLLTLGFRRRR